MESKVIEYLNGLNLEKHYVITGKPGSGKTSLAKSIADKLCEKHEFVTIDGKENLSYFKYQKLNENTKVVIFDDVVNIEHYKNLTEGIEVNRLSKPAIFINPKIILITDNIKDIEKSVKNKFNFIKIL